MSFTFIAGFVEPVLLLPFGLKDDLRTFGILMGLAVGVALAAIFLRFSSTLYNKLVPSSEPPRIVPVPGFWKAAAVVGISGAVTMTVAGIIHSVANVGSQLRGFYVPADLSLFAVFLDLILRTFLCSAFLPTSRLRAFIVVLMSLAMGWAFAGVVIGAMVLSGVKI